MKKQLLLFAFLISSTLSFAQGHWNMGIQVASVGNKAQYAGGMENANACFHQSSYNACGLSLAFRYTATDRWSFQTGLGFSELGFNYAIANEYSLLRKSDQYSVNSYGFGVAELPVAVIYNFKPNCKNYRWYIGAGGRMVSRGKSVNIVQTPFDQESALPSLTLAEGHSWQHLTSPAFTTVSGNLMVGIEKILKKGNMLSLGLLWNKGFMPLATSEVKYTINGTEYEHTFSNYGDYCGLTLTYYFKPFGSNKLQ